MLSHDGRGGTVGKERGFSASDRPSEKQKGRLPFFFLILLFFFSPFGAGRECICAREEAVDLLLLRELEIFERGKQPSR